MSDVKKGVNPVEVAELLLDQTGEHVLKATGEVVHCLKRKKQSGWTFKSHSGKFIFRFHISRYFKDQTQTLTIQTLKCEKTNALPGTMLKMIVEAATKHRLRLTFEVGGLPVTAADYVEKTYHCERTGELLIFPLAA